MPHTFLPSVLQCLDSNGKKKTTADMTSSYELFHPLSCLLALCKLKTDLFSILTLVTESIFYRDPHYASRDFVSKNLAQSQRFERLRIKEWMLRNQNRNEIVSLHAGFFGWLELYFLKHYFFYLYLFSSSWRILSRQLHWDLEIPIKECQHICLFVSFFLFFFFFFAKS